MARERKQRLLQGLRQWWREQSRDRASGASGFSQDTPPSPAVQLTRDRAAAADCREDAVLILSHTDPQVSVSGVDRFVRAEIEALEKEGFLVWVLSPRAGLTPRTYTWRRGKDLIADHCSREFVQSEVEALLATGRVRATAIHHLLGFEPELLEALGTFSGTDKILVYLHDEHVVQFRNLAGEFSFLARNFGWDETTFAELLPRIQTAADRLLGAADEVLLPSAALHDHLAAALQRLDGVAGRCRVVPEVIFTPYREKDPLPHTKPRLAYLGHALPNKGWLVWQGLLADPEVRARFEIFHIGDAQGATTAGVETVPYSTCDGNPYASVALLQDHEIDLVLLWSTVVESASYTMAEAHAAGVPVLTGRASGNIAASVTSGDVLGRVFENEAALRGFLLDPGDVDSLVTAGAAQPLRVMHHQSFLSRMLAEARV